MVEPSGFFALNLCQTRNINGTELQKQILFCTSNRVMVCDVTPNLKLNYMRGDLGWGGLTLVQTRQNGAKEGKRQRLDLV